MIEINGLKKTFGSLTVLEDITVQIAQGDIYGLVGKSGAGGIGAVALTYGYQSFNKRVMLLTVLILIVFVQAIQGLGNYVYKKLK